MDKMGDKMSWMTSFVVIEKAVPTWNPHHPRSFITQDNALTNFNSNFFAPYR